MMREIIATGRTVEDAITAGCESLELEREAVDFEIIDMPSKKFFGLSQTPARVRVFVEIPEETKAEISRKYLEQVLTEMGLKVKISATTEDGDKTIRLKIEGDTAGISIGRRGETLDALQYLTGLAANRGEGEYVRIVIDSGNYREKRKATLENLAQKLGQAVLKTGKRTTLEPMNPYERRIIHSVISEIEGVTSASVGEEPNRCVVISCVNAPANAAEEPAENSYRRSDSRPPRREGERRGHDRGGDRRDRGERRPFREKPEPYQATATREVAPAEAENQPLYGKIEI